MYPPSPAAINMYMGLTPNANISMAEAMGIQQLLSPIFAFFARVKVGAAINATTAGLIPLNMAAIHGTSMNLWKNSAIIRIMMNEGRAVPRVVHKAPRFPLSL